MMKRILSGLLALLMVVSILPVPAYAEDGTTPAAPDFGDLFRSIMGAAPASDVTLCDTCGNDPCTCESDEPTAGYFAASPVSDVILCDTCGNDPCTCESDEPTAGYFAASPVKNTETADFAVLPVSADYSDDVGQYAVLNTAGNFTYFDISFETPTSAFDTDIVSVGDFSTDILFEIAAAEVVTETCTKTEEETGESTEFILSSLWYLVNVVQGDAPDELQDGFWIFQNYLNEEWAYENPVLILQDPPAADPEPTPTDKADPDTSVVVSAKLPADITLDVTPKAAAETGLTTKLVPAGSASLFYDVTLLQNGAEYQPEGGVTVTFPAAAIAQSGLAAGAHYHVIHIHDGKIDMTAPAAYNGGDITADFANLSIVGIVEAATPVELFQKYGTYKEESIAEQELTIINDSITLYDSFGTDVYAAQVSGVAGMTVKVFKEIAFATDNFVLYQFAYYGDDPEFSAIARTYQFISAADVADSAQEEEYICAICGEVNCTTAHLYCNVCRKFDCGESHTHENPYKPVTAPVIPENPQLTPNADVSIVDEEGYPLTDTNGLQLLERTKTSISAWTELTENVNYQWQICYDAENNLWADIQGQTGQGLLISPAMVNSVIQQTGSAAIRCRVTSGDTVQYSASIPVEVVQSYSVMKAMNSSAKTAGKTALAADSTGLTNYSVVINYVFKNNEVVADSYTATLAAGSNFSATVKFPTIMGYLPYLNDATDTSTEFTLNIENIQGDVTYTVTYKPTNVNYTVIHYKQNADNDGYIMETETKQGLTKSTVPEVAKNDDGFYALLYEHPEIAADGSTVVEIYYDREYYLMTFDLGEGGYGVEPIYARYGTTVEIGTPTRPGYTFNGWSPAVPSTVPVDGGKYTAQWTPNDTAKVKIVIWGENPDDEDYSYLATGELMLTPNTEYTYNGTDQLYLYCEKEEHTHTAQCLSCGKEEHTQHTEECLGECPHTAHEFSCYSAGNYKLVVTTKPTEITSYPTDGIYTYTTGLWGRTTHYYLYWDGEWYCAESGDWGAGGDDTEITLNCTHTHTDECYACETHTHTAACYKCGKKEHSHDKNCTGTVAGLDSTLWTFVKSDTITVNPNGSSVINVFYDRTEFTLHFKQRSNSSTDIKTIKRKWGADIHGEFPIETSGGDTILWNVPSKCESFEPGTYLASINRMPAENITFTKYDEVDAATIYYCIEVLPGENYEYTHTYNGTTKYFKLYKSVKYTKSGYLTYAEEFHDIQGFKQWDSDPKFSSFDKDGKTNTVNNNNYLYYTRNTFKIEFYNPTTLLKKETGVPYQSPLSSYDWTPDATRAPAQYEPGSVVFDGWYLNPECTGVEFDFTTHTMPAGTNDGDTTLTLYAKWTPVMRTVEFYLDKTAMENDAVALEIRTTSHGSSIKDVKKPTNGGFDFAGWYYIDETGKEQRFDFETMVVTKDMKVYAKWSSNVLKEYIVYYKIQGTETQIGKPITSSARAGDTKTFDAKGGTDLYEGYQEGYFPLVQSHSMILDINTPEAPGPDANGIEWVEITNADGSKKIVQSFTFEYVQKDAVPYTVYYVAETLKDGDTSLGTIERNSKTYHIIAETYTDNENRKAVVTEQFKPVTGYMPDAYQKRLVVDGTEGAVNEIIFYYTVDNEHAYYKITHYTQNTDGEAWTEHASSEAVGDIGETYTADPMTIDGFTYAPNVEGTVVSGVLTADGLELKLYYVRNSYPYEVRYLERGTGKQLADPKTETGLYGEVVSESAIEIENYDAVDPTSQTLIIKIEESQTEAKLNIITFYYEEQQATINYVAVGNGSVAPISETVKVLSGKAVGSTATAANNYKFVGWYSDEACTNQLSTNPYYAPQKETELWVDGTTYYAKFEPDVGSLTITKTANGGSVGDTFIFHITGGSVDMDVTISGSGSVTIYNLPLGSYTVTENTDWSWRYTADKTTATADLSTTPDAEVTFTNTYSTSQWLNDVITCDNIFGNN